MNTEFFAAKQDPKDKSSVKISGGRIRNSYIKETSIKKQNNKKLVATIRFNDLESDMGLEWKAVDAKLTANQVILAITTDDKLINLHNENIDWFDDTFPSTDEYYIDAQDSDDTEKTPKLKAADIQLAKPGFFNHSFQNNKSWIHQADTKFHSYHNKLIDKYLYIEKDKKTYYTYTSYQWIPNEWYYWSSTFSWSTTWDNYVKYGYWNNNPYCTYRDAIIHNGGWALVNIEADGNNLQNPPTPGLPAPNRMPTKPKGLVTLLFASDDDYQDFNLSNVQISGTADGGYTRDSSQFDPDWPALADGDTTNPGTVQLPIDDLQVDSTIFGNTIWDVWRMNVSTKSGNASGDKIRVGGHVSFGPGVYIKKSTVTQSLDGDETTVTEWIPTDQSSESNPLPESLSDFNPQDQTQPPTPSVNASAEVLADNGEVSTVNVRLWVYYKDKLEKTITNWYYGSYHYQSYFVNFPVTVDYSETFTYGYPTNGYYGYVEHTTYFGTNPNKSTYTQIYETLDSFDNHPMGFDFTLDLDGTQSSQIEMSPPTYGETIEITKIQAKLESKVNETVKMATINNCFAVPTQRGAIWGRKSAQS